jgi:hypothetical protein
MGHIRTIALVALCASPSAAFSIGPQVAGLWNGSAALDAGVVGFLTLQTAATLIIVLASHAAGTAETWTKTVAALGLSALIACMQFGAALEVASHKRDLGAGVGVRSAAAVERDLTAALDSRKKLPQLAALPQLDRAAHVTALMVAAATESREGECSKRGPLCRDREGEERDLLARRPLSEQIEKLEAEMKTAPRHLDGMAHRVALILRKLGVDADEASVTDWWPTFQAFIIELIAAAGPYALSRRAPHPGKPEEVPTIVPAPEIQAVAEPITPPAEPLPEPAARPAAVAKTGVGTKSRNSRKPKATKAAAVTPVRDWYDSRTTARPGYDQPCGEAHDDYKAFSLERGETAMTLTAFGIAMKDEIGVEKIVTPSKRNYYRGIALKGRMRLVANQ